MPRATKQVLELRHCIDKLTERLAEQGQIVCDLRKHLEGVDRANKGLEEVIKGLQLDANEDEQYIKTLEEKHITLQLQHDLVCRMWANTMAQFDTCEIATRMSA